MSSQMEEPPRQNLRDTPKGSERQKARHGVQLGPLRPQRLQTPSPGLPAALGIESSRPIPRLKDSCLRRQQSRPDSCPLAPS